MIANPRAGEHEPLAPHLHRRWMRYGQHEPTGFPAFVGLVVEDVRVDYCRMRLPWRTEMTQPFGSMHGGAVATLIDSVVVPAIGSAYDHPMPFATVDLTLQFLGALRGEDAVAEGWITQRGRSMVFCEAAVAGGTSGRLVARGLLTYKLLEAQGDKS
jgi:uncharacterized protein (TIGR00369 family)